ncbi:MAG: hypothetical protein LQ345_002876 [Seirophora villosa]|nr:MAG: hypothetical protein LQ345_002876 [Seirophora villosa]
MALSHHLLRRPMALGGPSLVLVIPVDMPLTPSSRCTYIILVGPARTAFPMLYVEMLEQQQAQLVNALQEMYKRMTNNEGWKGDLLEPSPNGNPLTHDILVRLDALEIDGRISPARFEEDTDVLQRRLLRESGLHIKRQPGLESDSDEDNLPPPQRRSWTDSIQQKHSRFPPTPPIQTQSPFITASPTIYGASAALDSTLFHSDWVTPSNAYDHPYGFDPSPPPGYSSQGYLQQPSNPGLDIPTEWEEDFGNMAFVNLDTRPKDRSQPPLR